MESGAQTREQIVGELVARNRLWPLINFNSCRFCARPRKPEHVRGYATCYDCKRLHDRYGGALADLVPITYSTKGWPLGEGLREFKDRHRADTRHALAARFGAVLSIFLEHQMDRIAPAGGFDIVLVAPSSRPVAVNSLARAAQEGWWVPELASGVVEAVPDFPRQRTRPGKARAEVKDKWVVDDARVLREQVLLVDDFVTTGGTIHSLAKALRSAGAKSVTAIVLARNIGDDGEWVLPHLEEAVAAGRVWTPHQNKRDVLS